MYRLPKREFSQSDAYFILRNTKQELTTYFREPIETKSAGVFPSQSLAQRARNPPRIPADRRTRGLRRAAHYSRNSGSELLDLYAGVRRVTRGRIP